MNRIARFGVLAFLFFFSSSVFSANFSYTLATEAFTACKDYMTTTYGSYQCRVTFSTNVTSGSFHAILGTTIYDYFNFTTNDFSASLNICPDGTNAPNNDTTQCPQAGSTVVSFNAFSPETFAIGFFSIISLWATGLGVGMVVSIIRKVKPK